MWDKQKLMNLIEQKEQHMFNTNKTSQEEKKMQDEIRRMEATLKYIPAIAKLKEQKDNIYKDFKITRDKARVVQQKITKEKEAMDKLKQKLNENKKDEEEKKEDQELDEEGKPIKKKRVLTKEEQDLEDKIQKLKAEISELYAKKDARRDQFKKDMDEFDQKKFEKAKAEFMHKVQQRLKREQKRKEWEEMKKKEREEDEKLEKELLKTKYQQEILLCDNLIRDIEKMKPSAEGEKKEETAEQPEELNFNLENSEFKTENVTLLIGKKNKFGEETVERKKKKKKQKGKKVKKQPITDKSKLSVGLDKIQQFDRLKIMPPTTYAAIDDTVKEL